jgi:hypothetical protein
LKLDNNFSYILEWGSNDSKASNEVGKFNHPHGIDVDSKGYVYVNELENPRIQKSMKMVHLSNNGVLKGRGQENLHLC